MNKLVFLDASFWITYREAADARQPEARRVVADLFRERCRFVTTLPVICEIHATFSRNMNKRAQVLADLCDNPLVTIESVSPSDQKAALQILRASRDKTYPLCDALSFVVMRRLHVRRAASFDNHFRQFGEFEIVC
jgi:predicted nucleic acid-binding protein